MRVMRLGFLVGVGVLGVVGVRSVVGAEYVVDSGAGGAADTNVGTEERPWKTLGHAAEVVKAGDVVDVMAGHYGERVKIKASGAEGRPIVFRGMPARSAVVEGFELAGDYIEVSGFEITAGKPATAVKFSGSHCGMTDNYIHDMFYAVDGTVGKDMKDGTRDYSAVSHNRVAYNKVYHNEFGFILGGNDWLVEDNEVQRLFMYADPAKKNVDCDYSRFFGKGCVQRYNYYHGSTKDEIKTAHVDCIQTFMDNGGLAQDLLFQENVCFDFHQTCMVESAPHIGNVRNWTFRGNILSTNSPTMRGGWGPDIIQTPDVTIENNTISTVNWSTIGLRGKESTNGQIRNNILCDAERAVVDGDKSFTAAAPVMEYNLTYKTKALKGETNINGKDPMFVDGEKRDFRLREGSAAIGAGKGGVTVGAEEYPNVWYVDPRHPAAADVPAWGYAAVPLATVAKACSVAKAGETVVLRGGIYRETLRPAKGVRVRAMKGETVTISGADAIEGWKRGEDGSWSAEMAKAPVTVLRDGKAWTGFTYDAGGKKIVVKTGGDPRLHLMETVVREQGFADGGKGEGIEVVNLLQGAGR